MKNKKVKMMIIIFVVLAFICGTLFLFFVGEDCGNNGSQKDSDKGNEFFTYIEKDAIATNERYSFDLNSIEANFGDNIVYSMYYNAEIPDGNDFCKRGELSGEATTALLFGYPIWSAEQMGVNTDEEARMATQFAIWTLAQEENNDDSKVSEYIFDMDDLIAKDGYEESLERIKITAKGLIDIGLKSPSSNNLTLNIKDDESRVRLQGEYLIVGPYMISAGGYNNVESIDVSLVGAPDSAVLCDVEGNQKNELIKKGEEFYIRVDNNIGERTFTLCASITGTYTAGVIYSTGIMEDSKQMFCMMETMEDKKDVTTEVIIPEMIVPQECDVRGHLKVINVDESKEKRLAGITFEILNENGIVVETLISDENGEIISQELPKGKYYFREISGPNNIHIIDDKYEFEIIYDGVTEVYTLLSYYARAKLSMNFTDEDEKPLEGVAVQITDENHNIVDTIYSDSNGSAISKYLLLGKYYYQQISVPEGIVIDNNKYEFTLTKSMQILEVEEECMLERN